MTAQHTLQNAIPVRRESDLGSIQRLIALLPYLGFMLGMLMWLVDATIDVTFIHPDEEFWEAVFTEESTELWMRTLVVIVMTVAAVFVQYFMRRLHQSEVALLKYQHHLEHLVDERTRELQRLASFDPLTNIYNRRRFCEILESEMERARRYKLPMSLILCDLDHFKEINDRHGHNEGDRVLRAIAAILSTQQRQSDTYARWGGEEFILLLPHTDIAEAQIVAEKLRERISSITYGSDQHAVTASLGVSRLQSDDQISPLVKRADDALYQAKRNGRNRVCTVV